MVSLGVLLVLLLVVIFFVGLWGNLLVVSLLSFTFLDVQTTLVAEFYEVIYAIEQAQKMSLTSLWLECDFAWFMLHLLLGLMFLGCFVISGILVLTTVRKSGFGFLTLFVKGMHVRLISLLTQTLFIESIFIGIIGFDLVFS